MRSIMCYLFQMRNRHEVGVQPLEVRSHVLFRKLQISVDAVSLRPQFAHFAEAAFCWGPSHEVMEKRGTERVCLFS